MKKRRTPIRILPPKYKNEISFEANIGFSWLERLQLAIGYNFNIKVSVLTEHSPGKVDHKMYVKTTKELLNEKH